MRPLRGPRKMPVKYPGIKIRDFACRDAPLDFPLRDVDGLVEELTAIIRAIPRRGASRRLPGFEWGVALEAMQFEHRSASLLACNGAISLPAPGRLVIDKCLRTPHTFACTVSKRVALRVYGTGLGAELLLFEGGTIQFSA